VLRAAIAAAAHDPELRAALQNDVIGWRNVDEVLVPFVSPRT
jgi:hypothetical protein